MKPFIGDATRAVIFDHDDTLVGTMRPKFALHKYVARKYYHKELTDEEIASRWGIPFSELLCRLYGTDNLKEALANNTAHRDEFPKDIFAGTLPVLGQLKADGKLVGIVTATLRASFEYDLEQFMITDDLLDYIQTEEETAFHKPDKRVFDPLLNWLNVRGIMPQEVLYVGDSLRDMTAAVGAGFMFIGVETGMTTRDQFLACGATSIPDVSFLIG
jgi:phosphoglycolate phosphatase-like HAD superfamily hydrolase